MMSDNSISKFSAKKAPVAKPSSPLSSLASTNPKNLKGNYCLGIIPAVNTYCSSSKQSTEVPMPDWSARPATTVLRLADTNPNHSERSSSKTMPVARLLQRRLSKLTEWRSVNLQKEDGKLCQTSTTSLNNLSGDNDKMKYISNWTTSAKISLYEHFNQKILVVITKLSTS